jgi:hypothetical protein
MIKAAENSEATLRCRKQMIESAGSIKKNQTDTENGERHKVR